MHHFVSRKLVDSCHDYQNKIRDYYLLNIIPENWCIEFEGDSRYYHLKDEIHLNLSEDYIELIWYQLESLNRS